MGCVGQQNIEVKHGHSCARTEQSEGKYVTNVESCFCIVNSLMIDMYMPEGMTLQLRLLWWRHLVSPCHLVQAAGISHADVPLCGQHPLKKALYTKQTVSFRQLCKPMCKPMCRPMCKPMCKSMCKPCNKPLPSCMQSCSRHCMYAYGYMSVYTCKDMYVQGHLHMCVHTYAYYKDSFHRLS